MSLFHDIVKEFSGINRIDESKQMLKINIIIIIVGTIAVGMICLGIMYLRFRVFGGWGYGIRKYFSKSRSGCKRIWPG